MKESDLQFFIPQLTAIGENALTVEQKLELVRAVRGRSKDAGGLLDQFFIEEVARLRTGLAEAQRNQNKLAEALDRLKEAPWHPAIFQGMVRIASQEAAMVGHGPMRRAVLIAEDVDPDSLHVGDEVVLSKDLNMIVGMADGPSIPCGETALFNRYTPDGRLVIKCRDEEIVVQAAEPLRAVRLKSGDLVRWDRVVFMAIEKIERSQGAHLFLEETPAETFQNVGGLGPQIAELQRSIWLHLRHPDIVQKYRLRRKGSVLLVGPPGTGKTMIARALANWLAEISSSRRSRFMNIKPASLHSVWYSESEHNYRRAFEIARQAGEEEPDVPVVMFFDEIDSVGTVRGGSFMRVDDRVLTAFMTELDGLESRGNVLVVAATNRRDVLDPGLLRPGRLGDLILEISRPNRNAAREIFGRYLREDMPYAPNGNGPNVQSARQHLIDLALSRMYSPNGESELAAITFRDGKRNVIRAADLASGAVIANIVQCATERACAREAETGEAGIQAQDVLTAIAEEFDSIARTLTPLNCHKHLTNLPQDVDVVRVEPVQPKVRQPHRYLNVG